MEAHGAGANPRGLDREQRVVALVAARNEAGRIGPCVRALRSLAGEVVVVDDGSGDATAAEASEAGATVLRTGRRTGKGGALEGALRRLGVADLWLLADGDLGATASNLTPLLEAVTSGEAGLAIAVLPPARARGFGIVKRFAARLIRGQTGFRASEPLSGQRALTSQAMQAVRPLARGFGVETAMTIDAARAGVRVVEIPIEGLEHRPTYRTPRGFLHRGRQGWDIAREVLPRILGPGSSDDALGRPPVRWGRLLVENHRGELVPRVLGIALAIDAVVWTVVVATFADVGAAGWGALGGLLLVFGAGLIDDLVLAGPRGLRDHLRSAASGHPTTGLVKILVIAGSAMVVIALQPPRPTSVQVLGIVLLAACANVWNGLDVVPGRSLKAFLLPGLAFAIWGVPSDAPAVVGLLVGAVVVLPFDLRETAMLGDSGANLLGFAAGIGLYDALPDPWVAVAAGVAVGLNVLAETVSFSRVIERTPPLRWVDALGRRA